MQSFMELVLWLGPWNWLVFAVVLVVLETIIPGIHFVWFGMAATVVGLIAVATGLDWQSQLMLFGILSVVTAFALRYYAGTYGQQSDEPRLNSRASNYVGRVVVVEEAIVNGRGRVKVGDSLWIAQGPDTPAGSHVRIASSEGTVLVVELA